MNYHEFNRDEALIEKIIELDKNDDLFAQMLLEPFFHNNEINEFVDKIKVRKQLQKIINTQITSIASTKPDYYFDEPMLSLRINTAKANFKFAHNYRRFKGISIQKVKIKLDKMRGK